MIKRCNINTWLPAMLALVGLAFLAAPPSARAVVMLEVTEADFDFLTNTFSTAPGSIHSIVFVAGSGTVAPGTTGDPDLDGDTDVIGSTLAGTGPTLLVLGPGATVQVGAFSVQGSTHQSNSPGSPVSQTSDVISSSLAVTNTVGGTHTQQVVVGDIGFMFPVGPDLLTSQMFGLLSGTGSSVTIGTWDDLNNKQFGGSFTHPDPGNSLAGIPGGSVTFTASYNQTFNTLTNVTRVPYAKSIEFDITLGPNGTLNQRSNSITDTPALVPEPATMMTALASLPLVLGIWARRRVKTIRRNHAA